MSGSLDKAERLQFLLIDDGVKQALTEFRQVLLGKIDALLDDFYAHARTSPNAMKTFTGQSMERARDMQKHHWLENVFSGRFDDDYFAQIVRIGQAHARVGLEPRWYIAAYCYALNRLLAIAGQHYRKTPDRLVTVLAAINKAVFLDMDLAISVYLDSLNEKLQDQANRFERDISTVVKVVAAATNELQSSSTSMVHSAEQTAQQASEVAAAAGHASVNVQTVAAATEQLASSILEINRQVVQSNQIVGSAASEAEKTNQKMQGLTEAASRIGEVVKLINNIASQTNLLALNATIEAARAGEAGKGFAVVAGEVKNLANQTAKATEDISAQILAVQNATRDAVSAISGIGGTISKMNEIAAAIAAAVEEQGVATKEIARNIQEAASGTDLVTSHIGLVTRATGETGHAAREVLTATGELSRQTEHLSVSVSEFLVAVKSA